MNKCIVTKIKLKQENVLLKLHNIVLLQTKKI